MIPDFERLDDIARAGLEDEDGQVGAGQDVEFGLADADRFDDDAVHAEGVQDVGDVGGRGGESAAAFAGGLGADEDARVADQSDHGGRGRPGRRRR